MKIISRIADFLMGLLMSVDVHCRKYLSSKLLMTNAVTASKHNHELLDGWMRIPIGNHEGKELTLDFPVEKTLARTQTSHDITTSFEVNYIKNQFLLEAHGGGMNGIVTFKLYPKDDIDHRYIVAYGDYVGKLDKKLFEMFMSRALYTAHTLELHGLTTCSQLSRVSLGDIDFHMYRDQFSVVENDMSIMDLDTLLSMSIVYMDWYYKTLDIVLPHKLLTNYRVYKNVMRDHEYLCSIMVGNTRQKRRV